MSVSPPAPPVPSNSDYDLGPINVHALYGVMSIGGSLTYV